jgi:hypothetical protein
VIAAAALPGGSAPGQELARIPAPLSQQWVADFEFRALPGPTYDGASGQADELPYTLDLYQARLDLSYSLSDRVSPGVFVTYRENRYCCAMGSAITDKGVSGFGAFLDFLPRKTGSGSPVLRLEYEHATRGDGSVLPVSDRQDKLLAFSDWRLLAGRGDFTGLGGHLDLDFGFGRAQPKAYYRAGGELASGFVLARSERLDLEAAGTLGYSAASDDRENGTVFHNRHSTQVHAGAEVDLGFGRGRGNQIRLEARHDIVSRNALSGWRLGLTFRRRLGPRE